MQREDDDPIVITYHDTTLRQSEVDILSGSDWLNDNLIAFWFEYLTHDVLRSEAFLCIDPSTMFMISFTDDINELRELLSPLKLTERRMVFMPINNHNSIETAGGSHWSLLVYNRDSNQLHYYDSLRSHNIAAARKTARKMAPLLLQEGEGEEEPAFVVASSPQQINSSDCGLYVCAISEYIGKQFQQQQQSGEGESETSSVTRSNSNGKTLEQEVTPTNVSAKRKQMKELILQLKIKQEEKKKGGAGGIFSLRRGKRKEQQT